MSVTPGPVAMPSLMAKGRSAAVPGSNTVSMWPMHSSVTPSGSVPGMSAIDRLAQPEVVRLGADRRPQAAQPVGRPGAHLVDPGLRVAPQSVLTRRSRSAR